MTGYNLPMGCRESDIGGDDPEDITVFVSCDKCQFKGDIEIEAYPYDYWEAVCETKGCDTVFSEWYEPYQGD
jgi:hypothetical protein